MNNYRECKIPKKINIVSLYTAFTAERKSDFYFPGETHDFWEIVTVLDGSVGITAETDVYLLTRGQMVIHRPMEFHKIWSELNTSPKYLVISFKATDMPDFSGRIFNVDAASEASVLRVMDGIGEAFELCDWNVVKVKESYEGKAQRVVNRLENFLLAVLGNESVNPCPPSTMSARKYSEIVNILDENISRKLSVDEIASLCSMSASNLKKVFGKYSGMGVTAYFTNIKIRRAMAYLKEGRSVKETAVLLGFEDQNYFSTVFRRIVGQSPTEYSKSPDDHAG